MTETEIRTGADLPADEYLAKGLRVTIGPYLFEIKVGKERET